MYKLSANLIGHESDVKDLAFEQNDVVSVSRDAKCLRWTAANNDHSSWFPKTEYQGSGYLNSIAINKYSVFIGCLNGSIMKRGLSGYEEWKGHEKNVCVLDASDDQVVSGSWDCTARVWTVDGGCKAVLRGHEASVWGVLSIDNNTIVTSSADTTMKIWKDGTEFKSIKGHGDVVRGLCNVGNGMFASCSNDGSVKIWTVNGDIVQEMVGHTSYVYKVKQLPSGELVSCGEDRSVRIWKDGDCVQVITLPCTSVWSVGVNDQNGDIAVGGSDHKIRLFSREKSRWASEELIGEFAEEVGNSGIGKDQVGEVNNDQLSDASVLKQPGKKEGQVVMVKGDNGSTEAHQWTSGIWMKIGEVVGGNSTSSVANKKEFEGKMYDYVFDVDIEDGKPPLKLPFNVTENPYIAAQKFLDRNELPSTYLDQTAKFIIQNTEGVSLTNSSEASEDLYGTRYTPASQQQQQSTTTATKPNSIIIPHSNYLKLVSYQSTPIINAIKTNNEKQPTEKKLGDLEIELLEQNLQNITAENAPNLFKVAVEIVQNWEPSDMLPGLDVLRLAVASHPTPPTAAVIQLIFSTLDPDAPKHALLATRALVNLFSTDEGRKLVKNPQVGEQAITTVRQLVDKEQPQNARNIAVATLMLNYCVLNGSNSEHALGLMDNLAFFSQKFNDDESTYRLLLAFGTLMANNYDKQDVKDAAKGFGLNQWVNSVGKSEQRVADLVEEIKQFM